MQAIYHSYRFFYNPSAFAEKHLLVSDGMGHECSREFLIDRGYFNNCLLMFVCSGVLYVEQNGKKLEILPGRGVLMDLTVRHKYYFSHTQKSEILWFHFRGRPTAELMNYLNHNQRLPMFFSSDSIEKDICEIFELTRNFSQEKESILSARIYAVIMSVAAPAVKEVEEGKSAPSGFALQAEALIRTNLTKKLTLDSLAAQFHISRFYFCHMFKEQFGSTPFQYIRAMKIDLAKKLLLSTNDSISEIASYLNFYDQGHFCSAFKQKEGCSPKQYRAAHCFYSNDTV